MKNETIFHPNVGTLLAHPLNRKVYGNEPLDIGLMESMRNVGVLEPILVVKMKSSTGVRYYVVSGHRRFLAAKKLGHKTIPARELAINPDDSAAIEQVLIEANRQRNKTWEQKGREFIERRRIESEMGKRRRLSTLKQGNKLPDVAILPPRERGKARDIAAEKSGTGLGARTLEKLAKLIEAKDSDVPGAWALLDMVNENAKSINQAFKELQGLL
jgi:hypothetical protein